MQANQLPLPPGDHRRTLTVGGYDREYLVHVPRGEFGTSVRDASHADHGSGDAPESFTTGSGRPVVLAFHGGGSNAEVMVDFCGLNDWADRHGFLAVYPSGTGRVPRARTWNGGNCCGYAKRHGVDDVQFVAALLDDLQSVHPCDPRRVYATGMSNGGMLCYRLASELAPRIAAIAPVAGPMGTAFCNPARPVPVCHFHGTRDEFAPYDGGRGWKSLSRTDFYSVDHGIRCWVAANRCVSEPRVTRLPQRVADGTAVTRATWGGGDAGSEVLLYTIDGMGHCWPGRRSEFPFLGHPTANLLANEVMWEFFRRHPIPSEGTGRGMAQK